MSQRFITPDPEQIRSVLADSHALWGAGLSLPDYIGMWDELAVSRWATQWFSWRALVDDEGRVLSSLKLYRPLLRLGETIGRVAAIGAVFTSRSLRRRGYAAELMRATLDEAASRGDRASILFTDIGVDYYKVFGYTPLPCEDAVGSLPASGDAGDGVTFRPMLLDDLDAVAEAHTHASAARSIAIVRDREHWEFLLQRAATFFERLDGSNLDRRFMMATRGKRAIGHVVAVAAPGEWNLREAEAIDGTHGEVKAILAAAAAQARAEAATTVWGWIPREDWPLVRSWRLRAQPRLRAVPMIRMLDGSPLPDGWQTIEGSFIPYLDQF